MIPQASASFIRQTMAACVVLLALCAGIARAQGRGGGPGGGPGGPMGGGGMGVPGASHGPFGNLSRPDNRDTPPNGTHPHGSEDGGFHGGLQLGPPGRWWDDRRFAESIGLDSAQQRRMDDVFGSNKGILLKLYKNLQREESQLGKVTRARELNEAQIFDQIDRVVQARGELEKASAHMLLQIRREMTQEQASRLDDQRPMQ